MSTLPGRPRYGGLLHAGSGSGLFRIVFLIFVVLGIANFFFGRGGR